MSEQLKNIFILLYIYNKFYPYSFYIWEIIKILNGYKKHDIIITCFT